MHARTYIYIIGIALLLQGCRKESHPATPDIPDATPYAINMSPAEVRGGTRALIDNVSGLQDQGFKVYGYKVDRAAYKQQVFFDENKQEGQVVAFNKTIGSWQYAPVRYWDRVADYSFAAYAPDTLPGGMAVENTVAANQTLTFTEMPHWQVAGDDATDLLVATSQGAATTYINTHGGQVNLAFNHTYAQLVVRVVHSASFQNTYRLTSVTYQHVPTADGTATYTLDYTTPASSAWSGVTMMGDGESMSAFNSDDGEEITSNTEATAGTKHLVVPFKGAQNIQVTVDYTVGGTDQSGTADTGISQLEAGKRYVLTLSLGSGAKIDLSLDIEEWKEEEIEEDDKYNW